MKKKKQAERGTVRICPTQKDIADALGISQSTVAMALSPQYEHRLLEATVARVREYAEKIGYHPQRSAQITQGKRSRIVGAVVRLGPYMGGHNLVELLANEINHAGYCPVLVDPIWFGGDHRAVRRYLLDQGVEGVVFCNVNPWAEALSLKEQLPPALPVFGLQSSLDSVPGISGNLAEAFYHLTRLHLAFGSRNLCQLSIFRDAGYVGRPGWTVRDRALGFAQAIQEAGGVVLADNEVAELMEIPGCRPLSARNQDGITGTLMYPVRSEEVATAYENGFLQTMKMIEGGEPPDSIICANDDAALGALAACLDRGVSVPGEMRLSGYDDTMPGRFAAVPLATIRPPLEEMVKRAVEGIVSLIQGEEPKAESLLLPPCEIVIRRSTGEAEEIQTLAGAGFFQTDPRVRFLWDGTEKRISRNSQTEFLTP